MKPKQWQNILYAIKNANSIQKLPIQIKNGIAKYVIVNLKIINIF